MKFIYIFEKIKEMVKEKHKDGSLVTSLETIEQMAKNAVLFGAGNCGEMTSLAFVFLLEYSLLSYQEIKIFFVALEEPGDHCYIILKDNFSNTVILDPWIKEIFLLNHLSRKSKWYNEIKNMKQKIEYSTSVGDTLLAGKNTGLLKMSLSY